MNIHKKTNTGSQEKNIINNKFACFGSALWLVSNIIQSSHC